MKTLNQQLLNFGYTQNLHTHPFNIKIGFLEWNEIYNYCLSTVNRQSWPVKETYDKCYIYPYSHCMSSYVSKKRNDHKCLNIRIIINQTKTLSLK